MSQEEYKSGLLEKLYLPAVALMFAAFVFQGAWFATNKSVTFDEASHLAAAVSAWRTGDFRIYPHNPPLGRMLSGLPLVAMGAPLPKKAGWESGKAIILLNEIAEASGKRFQSLLAAGRLVTLALTLALGLLVWRGADREGGKTAGLVAAALFCFQPVFIAHGSLMTVDAAGALFFFLAVSAVLSFQSRGWNLWRAMVAGVALGAAISAKFSNLSLLVILPVILAVLNRKKILGSIRRGSAYLAVAAFAALILLNAGYGFQGTFHRLDSHEFQSGLASTIARPLPGWLPVPLPYYLVDGFDRQSYDNENMGGKNSRPYWMGEWVRGPVHLFYPFLIGTKLTVPLLILGLFGIVSGIGRGIRAEAPLAAPASWLFAIAVHYILIAHVVAMYFSFRYLLALVPFLILFASTGSARLIEVLPKRWRPGMIIIAAVMASSLATAALTFPDYLAYNNILLGGEERQDRLDADTGRHWGQDLPALKKWIDQNYPPQPLYFGYFGAIDPRYYGIDWQVPPPEPSPGTWAVTRNWMIGDCPHDFMYVRNNRVYLVPWPKPYFGWLKGRKPSHVIGKSIYIYEIGD